ncbi:MAG: MFS transporter [Gammaproteobacteria bacterium]|nr:MAG: MFS transporter [Gammaproteobacteria bacterium]
MAHAQQPGYYVPHDTHGWPIVGSVGLTLALGGAAVWFNGGGAGPMLFALGLLVILVMLFGWFGQVIKENLAGLYNEQVDRSFRWAMGWFIASEVMFFAAFFGALYYARVYALPWLGGEGAGGWTHELLWPDFEAHWPSNGPARLGGEFTPMGAWGIPALNTAILLTSGVTITWAHHALKAGRRGGLVLGLLATVLLGATFVGLQAYEYIHAYHELNLRLDTGIYGSTFFMLTGFHGFHVTMGVVMLTVILLRALKGHFTPERHFAFEAVAWYWHFVDVVWLGLFVFVYWL